MNGEWPLLCTTALSVGAIHTLLGPDHYVPFAALSRAGGWTARKTLGVTVACGLGHVAGSVAIGAIGLLLGSVVLRFEAIESWRGDVAAWLLIGFGFVYLCWGAKRAVRAASHVHAPPAAGSVWTPWLAFLVFVLGPCEPLIPLLMVPAARSDPGAVVAVVAAFTAATLGTMVLAVVALRHGLACVYLPVLRRFDDALAGLAILVCGVLVKVGL
jgi:nickel/cobalt exporter